MLRSQLSVHFTLVWWRLVNNSECSSEMRLNVRDSMEESCSNIPFVHFVSSCFCSVYFLLERVWLGDKVFPLVSFSGLCVCKWVLWSADTIRLGYHTVEISGSSCPEGLKWLWDLSCSVCCQVGGGISCWVKWLSGVSVLYMSMCQYVINCSIVVLKVTTSV